MSYAVPRTVRDAKPHVFPYRIGNETVYVKKRRRGKNPVGKFFQRLLYRLTGNVLILPPSQPEGGSVRHEAGVLRDLAGRGLNVPLVLHEEEEYFVMSDVGDTLERVLRDNPKQKEYYVDLAARALRRLHDLGVAHGGTQVKNIAVKNGVVHFLDFEERIPSDQVDKFQLRDLFLFLFSLERYGFDPDFRRVCDAYGGDEGERVADRMRRLLGGLRAVGIVDSRLFGRMKLRDIRALNALIKKAERIEVHL